MLMLIIFLSLELWSLSNLSILSSSERYSYSNFVHKLKFIEMKIFIFRSQKCLHGIGHWSIIGRISYFFNLHVDSSATTENNKSSTCTVSKLNGREFHLRRSVNNYQNYSKLRFFTLQNNQIKVRSIASILLQNKQQTSKSQKCLT